MSRLRVAIVSTKRDWHGGEEQGRQLALGLHERDHDCHVLAPRSSEMAIRLVGGGVCLVPFPGGGRNPAAIWSMRRHLASFRPHVLHFNDSHALTAAGLASLGLAIPARVAARRVQFAPRNPYKYRLFADRVICVSREVACTSARCGMPRDHLRVVHDGVDPRRLCGRDRAQARNRLNVAADQTMVLTVARMSPEKGHRQLLDAVPAVLARYPHTVFLLAGDGPLRPALQRQAEQLGITRNTRFLGYRRDVPDLLAACDLFVFPSLTEGLGSTLIEAMLAQRPIVATSAGGIPDLVGPIPTDEDPVAHLVPPGDSRALSDAVQRALAVPARSARLARRGCERAWTHFTADRMVEGTLAVYRELLPPGIRQSATTRQIVRAA
jgi:glycosyltransferase involved in cell wall biosynthesis